MRPAVAVLAVLVATAGCTGFAGPSAAPTQTPAGTAEPTDRSPATGPDVGVTAEGVTDPRHLGAVHLRTVRQLRSYEATRRLTFRGPDGTVRGRIVHRVVASEGGRRFASRLTVSGDQPGRFAATQPQRSFSNGTVTVIPIRFGNHTEVVAWPADEAPVDGPPPVVDWRVLETVFGALDSRVAALDRRNGTAVYVVRGGPGTIPAWTAGNVTVSARITRSGFVRSLTVRYDVRRDRRWRVEQSVSYAGVNATTVARPPWVDAALANATRPVDDG